MQQISIDPKAVAGNTGPDGTNNTCAAIPENRLTRRSVLGSRLAGAALSALPVAAQLSTSQNRLSLGPQAERVIPLDYVGLSYETAQLADPTFFAAHNRELVSLFRSLNPNGVLRIGGNSSEFCWWKTKANQTAPSMPASSHAEGNWMPQEFTAIEPIAIENLAGFLDATGWKAIYGLNLGTGSPERDAEEAAYVAKVIGPRLICFQIGNEPEYYKNEQHSAARPRLGFCEISCRMDLICSVRHPACARSALRRARRRIKHRLGHSIRRAGAQAPSWQNRSLFWSLLCGRSARQRVHDSRASAAPDLKYESQLDRITAAALQSGIAYRMTEGNTCYRGGKPELSNAFCSALWAADYLLLLASRGAAGVNLHGGGSQQIRLSLGGHLPGESISPGAAATAALGSFYTPIAGSREAHFTARPVFYGMKIAGMLAGGRLCPVHFDTSPAAASAWAAQMPSGETRIVVVNKNPRQDLFLRVPSSKAAKLWRLEAANLTATSGVTLAGVPIEPVKSWNPLREEHIATMLGSISVTIPAASGAVLFLEGDLA